MSVRFLAKIMPLPKQGDHVSILITYTTETGETKRVSTAIIPEKIAAEFVELINGKSSGAAHSPGIVINGEPLRNVRYP
jgi:hypothetical protein